MFFPQSEKFDCFSHSYTLMFRCPKVTLRISFHKQTIVISAHTSNVFDIEGRAIQIMGKWERSGSLFRWLGRVRLNNQQSKCFKDFSFCLIVFLILISVLFPFQQSTKRKKICLKYFSFCFFSFFAIEWKNWFLVCFEKFV